MVMWRARLVRTDQSSLDRFDHPALRLSGDFNTNFLMISGKRKMKIRSRLEEGDEDRPDGVSTQGGRDRKTVGCGYSLVYISWLPSFLDSLAVTHIGVNKSRSQNDDTYFFVRLL